MKKYKIIKPYPGSENLGKEIEDWEIPTRLINDPLFSQYYEEVIEKDYEILEYISSEKHITIKQKNGLFYYNSNGHFVSEESLLRLKATIHSVKRLSDDEVFTVGDKYQVLSPIKETRTIGSFHISDNTLLIHSVEFGYSFLKKICKCNKKPLFTTEDGVDIFPEKDGKFQYWSLKLDNLKISNAPHILNSNRIIPTSTEKLLKFCNELRFSTKEAAEEYILVNKPCLSYNDIKNIINKQTINKNTLQTKLKQLVKSKLAL